MQVFLGHMEVLERGIQAALAHQDLNGGQVDSRFEQVRRKAVPERVNTVTVGDAGSLLEAIKGSRRGTGGHVAGTHLIGKEPSFRLELPPIETLHRDSEVDLLPHDFSKEEVDGYDLVVAGTGGELFVDDQKVDVVADLFNRDHVRRTPVVPHKLFHGLDVAAEGAGGLASQLKFADHALT